MALRAALLTPYGPGGIAVIRVAGDHLPELFGRIFQTRHPIPDGAIRDNRLRFGILRDGPDRIDQVVVAYNPSGPWADINCHGGPRIVQRAFMLLQRHGAAVCSWPDLLGGATVEQEVARCLPRTATALAALAVAAQYPGGLNRWCSRAIESIQTDRWPLETFRRQVGRLLNSWSLGRRLLCPARVVLAGPPNAGKSTLANWLCGRSQSLVSDLAGTTRDYTEHPADIDGVPVMLVDTAGRRRSRDPLEARAVELADRQVRQADLVLLTLSADQVHDAALRREVARSVPADIPMIGVAARSDRAPGFSARPDSADWIAVSAHRQSGLTELKAAIRAWLGFESFDPAAPLVFTERQRKILAAAQEAKDEYTAILILYKMLGWAAG